MAQRLDFAGYKLTKAILRNGSLAHCAVWPKYWPKQRKALLRPRAIAAGFLIAAIHQAGLVTLTHTPSPMGFLKKILQRPDHERPFLLLPVGYPANDAFVPDIQRKPLEQVSVFYP